MPVQQVATMLIVTQMINHFQEALLPYVVKKAYNQVRQPVYFLTTYVSFQPLYSFMTCSLVVMF